MFVGVTEGLGARSSMQLLELFVCHSRRLEYLHGAARYDIAPREGLYFPRLVAGSQVGILNGSRLRGES